MKNLLLTILCCLYTYPVFAQSPDVITIIRDDGSQQVIQIEPAPAIPEKIQPHKPKIEIKKKSEVATATPTIEHTSPPTSKPVVPVQTPTKKPKTVKRRNDTLALIPPRKPHRQIMAGDAPITKQKALYIALADAPPSRDVQVFNVQAEQGSAYSVLFKTESGMYEVLVDGSSGIIIHSGNVKVERSFVEPGHLPSRAVKGLYE